MIILRIQTRSGREKLQVEDITIQELKLKLQTLTSVVTYQQRLRSGYPPKLVTIESEKDVVSKYFQNGDIIIVECDETKEKPTTKTIKTTSTTSTTSTKNEKEIIEPPPIPQNEGNFFIRKMKDDNSCLFSAVSYIFENKNRKKASSLRELAISYIKNDPDKYNEGILGKSQKSYIESLKNPKTWGGGIELSIFAEHYKAEIIGFEIRTIREYRFGENSGYRQRGFVIFDGLHYDSIVFSFIGEQGDEEFDITLFSVDDQNAVNRALAIVKNMNKNQLYTDTNTFQLLCKQCNKIVIGEKGVVLHSKQTGHTQFDEVKK
ncbi:ubiquitin thioesterase otu1 [Anaeramoeba flamelloides]|uniref:Ubiquitin thioesterase OTU n=1 Tax=Anaeramoeba flamelloides TaxID=1746091 RepID=A0AAV7YZS1_9EUKA|nr:ubiquitin thioesterase otu1 [Anaeramoeba flamelloides]